jgi:hypothetical protein
MRTVRENYRRNRGVDYRSLLSLSTTKQIKDKASTTDNKFQVESADKELHIICLIQINCFKGQRIRRLLKPSVRDRPSPCVKSFQEPNVSSWIIRNFVVPTLTCSRLFLLVTVPYNFLFFAETYCLHLQGERYYLSDQSVLYTKTIIFADMKV